MSHVRLCDKCGEVFSENENGWQTFTATTMQEDENGVMTEVKQALDACPACAMIPKRKFEREQKALEEGKETEARIARLERETGLNEETGSFTK
jgi:hypothetical protein